LESFPATSWTLVVAASGDAGARAREGLERLCRLYWRPVHWHLATRWAEQEDDALDLTQAFFAWLIESDLVARYRGQGSFRGFLRAALDNFTKNELRRASSLKAGGAETFLSIEAVRGTDLEPPAWSPEAGFDELFAAALLEDAARDLAERLEAAGEHTDRLAFEAWFLGHERPTQAALAAELGLSTSALGRTLERTRRALRALLRARLRDTLPGDETLEDEFGLLFGLEEDGS
jgi:RNA polymerase sigma factor (sigma-70 family)